MVHNQLYSVRSALIFRREHIELTDLVKRIWIIMPQMRYELQCSWPCMAVITVAQICKLQSSQARRILCTWPCQRIGCWKRTIQLDWARGGNAMKYFGTTCTFCHISFSDEQLVPVKASQLPPWMAQCNEHRWIFGIGNSSADYFLYKEFHGLIVPTW